MDEPDRRRPRAASVKDVASLANVSPKTVSNVVNGIPRVTAETRDRVLRAIEQLGYRPNMAARNLRHGRTGIIALAVPELHVPYFADLSTAIIDLAQDAGFTVLVDQTEGDPAREAAIIEGRVAQLVDGIILSPLSSTPRDLEGRRDDTPIVLLGERVAPGLADHVTIDNVAAAKVATEHLITLGRLRIAAVGAPPIEPVTAGGLRLLGFREALRQAGLPEHQELIMPVPNYFRAEGARAMDRLLAVPEPPDAVFCFSDLMAIGAIRVLHDRGVRVPDDIAVIGFDDIEEGRFSHPRLSTMAPDKASIARESLRMLTERMAGDHSGPRQLTLSAQLIARESTMGADAVAAARAAGSASRPNRS
jgi:LacI family repressor for deo operon, udp, cdd, tsx, nupC, and nupG